MPRRQSGTPTWTIPYDSVTQNITTYNDTGLPASTKFYYRVRAYNAYRESANTAVAYDTTLAGGAAPVPPTDLTATAVSSSQIDLAWEDQSGNETGFRIDRRQSGTAIWTIPLDSVGQSVTSYDDTGLLRGVTRDGTATEVRIGRLTPEEIAPISA